MTFVSFEWDSIRLDGLVPGIMTKTVHKTLPKGGGVWGSRGGGSLGCLHFTSRCFDHFYPGTPKLTYIINHVIRKRRCQDVGCFIFISLGVSI